MNRHVMGWDPAAMDVRRVVDVFRVDPETVQSRDELVRTAADVVIGTRDGKEAEVFIYNVADHKEAFEEVGSQGISYTAGVPPVAAAILIARGPWDAGKMANVEDLPARPFLELLGEMGLPTRVIDASGDHPV